MKALQFTADAAWAAFCQSLEPVIEKIACKLCKDTFTRDDLKQEARIALYTLDPTKICGNRDVYARNAIRNSMLSFLESYKTGPLETGRTERRVNRTTGEREKVYRPPRYVSYDHLSHSFGLQVDTEQNVSYGIVGDGPEDAKELDFVTASGLSEELSHSAEGIAVAPLTLRPPCGTVEKARRRGCRCEVCLSVLAGNGPPPPSESPAPKPLKHGVNRYTKGCRCKVCKDAWAERARQKRREAKSALAVGQVMGSASPRSRHGVSRFRAGCRCEACIMAQRAMRARQTTRQKTDAAKAA